MDPLPAYWKRADKGVAADGYGGLSSRYCYCRHIAKEYEIGHSVDQVDFGNSTVKIFISREET